MQEAPTPSSQRIFRRIADNPAAVDLVLSLVRDRRKTGTFTLPWLAEHGAETLAAPGDTLVLTDFSGRPALNLRVTVVTPLEYGSITAADVAIDGPALRDLAMWRAFHEPYWNARLAPFGRVVTAAMPVHAEYFELLGPASPDS